MCYRGTKSLLVVMVAVFRILAGRCTWEKRFMGTLPPPPLSPPSTPPPSPPPPPLSPFLLQRLGRTMCRRNCPQITISKVKVNRRRDSNPRHGPVPLPAGRVIIKPLCRRDIDLLLHVHPDWTLFFLYVLSVLSVCSLCMFSLYVLSVYSHCSLCMFSLYVLSVCCIYYLCSVCMFYLCILLPVSVQPIDAGCLVECAI